MTRPARPVWLLDIDGVINAWFRGVDPPTHIWPQEQWIRVEVDGFTLWAARPVLDFISEVHRRRKAEIRWHTTWQHDAEKVGTAFGLPHFWVQDAVKEFANQAEMLLRGKWWKLPAAWRVVGQEQRPLVWTDDDIVDLNDRETTSLTRAGKTLLIAPTPAYGLTRSQLDRIAEFLGMD